MAASSLLSNSRTKKRNRSKLQPKDVEGDGGETSLKLQKHIDRKAKPKSSIVNPFLRSWAWKREPLPDRYKYDMPYVHRILVGGCEGSLTIQQKRFKETGFASTVWDSSIVLAKYLERWQETLVQGKRCIELGAGCGLVGICASRFGAASVALTDLPGNLPLLKRNYLENGAQATTVSELVWGGDVAHLLPPFDFILATDVIYDRAVIGQLVASLLALSNDRTHILIAYGRNRWAETEFGEAIRPSFRRSEIEREKLDSVYSCDDVTVMSLRRVKNRQST